MRTRPLAAVATGTLALVSLAAAPVAAGSTGDDQARADAAAAAFNEWMAQAGFQSDGPQELQDDIDDAEEDELTACFEGFEAIVASLAEPADGETARAYSDYFSRSDAPEATAAERPAPDSTDEIDDIGASDAEEYAAAFVVTFDEEHAQTAEQFVTHFGSDETADCFREQLDETLSVEAATTDGTEPTEYESSVEVVSGQDLAVGEHSARVAFAVETQFMGEPFDYTIEFFAAQVDRSIALVIHGTYGDVAPATIDYASALTAMVESLEG